MVINYMNILLLTTYQSDITNAKNSINVDPALYKMSTGIIYEYLKKDHEVTLALFTQLSLTISKQGIDIKYNSIDLKSYDVIFFRSVDDKGLDLEWLAQIVADYALVNKIKTINANHYSLFGCRWNKIQQIEIFKSNGFLVPDTMFGIIEKPQFPLIAKPIFGSQGKGIYLVSSNEQLSINSNELYQELLPNKEDYRVIVLGKKVLGVMLRKANDSSIVSNISAGGIGTKYNYDSQLEEISLRLAQLCKLDFCGIDLMKDADGNYAVLEVNRNPGIQGFQNATGVEVAVEIGKYLSTL